MSTKTTILLHNNLVSDLKFRFDKNFRETVTITVDGDVKSTTQEEHKRQGLGEHKITYPLWPRHKVATLEYDIAETGIQKLPVLTIDGAQIGTIVLFNGSIQLIPEIAVEVKKVALTKTNKDANVDEVYNLVQRRTLTDERFDRIEVLSKMIASSLIMLILEASRGDEEIGGRSSAIFKSTLGTYSIFFMVGRSGMPKTEEERKFLSDITEALSTGTDGTRKDGSADTDLANIVSINQLYPETYNMVALTNEQYTSLDKKEREAIFRNVPEAKRAYVIEIGKVGDFKKKERYETSSNGAQIPIIEVAKDENGKLIVNSNHVEKLKFFIGNTHL